MEINTVEIGTLKTRIATEMGGPNNVILVHGLMNSLEVWLPTMMVFRGKHNLIAYDQRAHGEAEVSDNDFTIDAYANDLHNIIQATGHKPHALVAHSFGCVVVQRYLQTYAGIPYRVVLLQSSPKSAEFLKENNFDLEKLAQAKIESYTKQSNANSYNPLNWLRPDFFTMWLQWSQWHGRGMEHVSLKREREMRALQKELHFDYTQKNQSVVQPGLTVIGGTNDEIINPNEVTLLASSLPGASLQWIKTGHMSMTAPEYFDKLREVL